MQRMDSIEAMLGAIQAQGVPSTGAAAIAPAPVAAPAAAPPAAAPAFTFSDVTEPAAGTATTLVEDRSLHLQQRAKMDFGRRLAGMLNMPEVEVVAASSLAPPSPPLAGFGTGGTATVTAERYDPTSFWCHQVDDETAATIDRKLRPASGKPCVCIFQVHLPSQ